MHYRAGATVKPAQYATVGSAAQLQRHVLRHRASSFCYSVMYVSVASTAQRSSSSSGCSNKVPPDDQQHRIPRVNSVTGGICSVSTLPNLIGVFGTAAIVYRTLRYGSVRTRYRYPNFGKLASSRYQYPGHRYALDRNTAGTGVHSVRLRYRYSALR